MSEEEEEKENEIEQKWIQISTHPNYEISNSGNVRNKMGVIIKVHTGIVNLYQNNIKKSFAISILLRLYFPPKDLSDEKWITITERPNYEISDLGNVRNKKTGDLIKHHNGKVMLSQNNKQMGFSVQRLCRLYFPSLDLDEEKWATIKDFDKYEISTSGRVRYIKTLRFLKPSLQDGYLLTTLTKGPSIRKQFRIHVLVAEAFLALPTENQTQVNHINGDKLDNNVINLEWVSGKENIAHARQNGLLNSYSREVNQIHIENGNVIATFKNSSDAELSTNINAKNIGAVCLGRQDSAGGFKWSYSDKRIGHSLDDMKDLPGEEWKQFEETNYRVSTMGRIANIKTGHILKLRIKQNNRVSIGLFINGKTHNYYVSVLVATLFIPNPLKLQQVDHIDNNPQNNHVNNLQWMTASENIRKSHAREVSQISLTGKLIKIWDCIKDASEILKCDAGDITRCCQGKKISCGGYRWAYVEIDLHSIV